MTDPNKEPSFEDLLAQLTSELGLEPQGSTAAQISKELPLLLKEADQYIEIGEEVLDKYLPIVKKYIEGMADYLLERDIKAINKVVAETQMRPEQAADYLIRRAQVMSSAFKK